MGNILMSIFPVSVFVSISIFLCICFFVFNKNDTMELILFFDFFKKINNIKQYDPGNCSFLLSF